MLLNRSAGDPAVCPLCGHANICAVEMERVTGEAQPPCWCMTTPIPAEVLAQIPTEARGLACVCQRCAERLPISDRAGFYDGGLPATQPNPEK